ncbi:MAG: hypothetical protein AAF682_05330 [Planctomycetota bacterium]
MRALRVAYALSAAVLCVGLSSAQTTWTGAVSTNWDNPFNWSTALIPTGADDVIIAPATNQPSTYIFGPACNDLTVQSGATLTLGSGFDLDVSGGVTIDGTLTVQSTSSDINVAGDWTDNGTYNNGGATVEMTGTGNLGGTAGSIFQDLVVNGGTRSAVANFTVDGDATVEGGATLDIAAGVTATVSGNWTSSSAGVSTTGDGSIEFVGTGSMTTGLNGLPNVLISSGTRTANASTVSGDLDLTGGTLQIGDNATLIVGGDAGLTGGTLNFISFFPGNETLDINGNATVTTTAGTFGPDVRILCAGDWSSDSSFDPSAGSVELDGAGSRTLSGSSPSFFNLRVVSGTVNSTSAISVASSLVIDTGATLDSDAIVDVDIDTVLGTATATWDMGGLTHTVGADWTSAGGSATNGTINFDGPGNVNTGGGTIDNVDITSGLRTVPLMGVATNLTLTAGEIQIADAGTLSVGGNANLNGGTLSFDDTSANLETLDVEGDVTITGTVAGAFGTSSQIHCAGNWNSPVTFTPTEGVVRLDGGTVSAVNGAAPTLHSVRLATGTKTFTAGATLTGDLRIDDGSALVTNGAMDIAGFVSAGDGTASWDMGGLTHTVGGSWTSTGASATNGTVNLDNAGGTLDTGSGTIANVLLSAGTYAAAGAMIDSQLTMTGGELALDPSANVAVGGNATLSGGTLSLGATSTLDVAGNVNVSGSTAGTMAADSRIEFAGDWTGSATFAPTEGTAAHDGAATASILGSDPRFHNLSIEAGTVTVSSATTVENDLILVDALVAAAVVTVNGGAALDAAASWDLGTLTHTVARNWTSGGGSATNGKIEFTDDGTTTFGGGTLDDMLVSGGARTMLTGTVTGDLELTGGTMRVTEDQALTVNGDATMTGGLISWFPNVTGGDELLTVDGNVVCNVGIEFESGNSQFFCGGNWTSDGTFTPSAVTVHLNGASPTTVSGTPSFFELNVTDSTRTITGPTLITGELSVAGTGVVDADAVMDINADVTLDATGTFDLGSLTHTVSGDWTSTGGSATGTGAINFDATGTLDTGTTASIPNVIVSAGTRSANTSLIADTLSMTGGTLRIENDQVLTVNGNTTLSAGTLAFNSGADGGLLETLDLNGDTDITCVAGTMDGNSLILCSGNWSSSSVWVPSDGSVLFDGGTATTIGGPDPTFNDAIVFDGDKTNSSALTVNGDLTVFGGQSLTSSAAIEVFGNVALLASATWNAGALTHTVHGDWGSTDATVGGTATIDFVDDGSLTTGASTVPNVLVSAGTRTAATSTVASNLDMTGGTLRIADNQTLTVQGDADLSGGTLDFNDVTAGDETLAVQGDANITATSGATSPSSQVVVNGNWTSTSAWSPANGTVTLSPAVASTLGGTSPTFSNLTLASGTVDVLVASTVNATLAVQSDVVLVTQDALDVNGNVSLGDATAAWDIGSSTHTVAGDWTSAGASATGSGTIEFDGPGTCDTGTGTLPNLLITAGPRSFSGANVDGNVDMTAGSIAILDDATFAVTGNANLSGGTLSLVSGAAGPEVFDVDGDVTIVGAVSGASSADAEFFCGGNWTSDGGFDPGSGTVILDGFGATTLGGTGLTLPDVRIAAGDKTLTDDASMASLELVSGATLLTNGVADIDGACILGDGTSSVDLGGLSHTVLGDWISSGCSATNGRVEFDGNGTLDTGSGSIANVDITAGVRVAQSSTIAGELTMTGGTLRIFDDQTLLVEGDANLTGGTLTWSVGADGGGDEVLDVEGNVVCTAAAGNTSSGSFFRCAGDWTSNGDFAMTSGTVDLDGSSDSALLAAGPNFDPAFPRLRISGATRFVTDDMDITSNQVVIEATGGMDVTGANVSIPTNPVEVNGVLSLGPDGIVGFGPTSVVIVTPTGTLNVIGAFGAPAVITGVLGSSYLMNIDGTLEAVNFRFERMGPAGITVNETATLVQMVGGVFSNPSPAAGSILLDIRRPSPTTISYVDFEDPAGVGSTNVRSLGGTTITFIESEGNFSGPGFEFDPLGLVEWVNDPTIVDSFTATPGPDVVDLEWVTSNETDSDSWVLQRAEDFLGPYSDITTIAAAGPSTYNFSDAGVFAGTTYFYRLVELKTFGLLDEVSNTTATPWGSVLPPNVLTVGASGAFADIQSAINAATFLGAVVRIEPGNYAPFTVSGPTVGTLRILGDGTGTVTVDTTTSPVTIQNVGIFDSVEMSDLTIGSSSSPNAGIVVQNCIGTVVLDELDVSGGTGQPGIRVSGSTQTAVQRCDVDGDPGILAELGSTAVVGRGTLDEIELTGTSDVRMAGLTATQTVDGSSTLTVLPGVHADIDMPEFVSLGQSFPVVLDGEVNGIYALAFSTSLFWFDLPSPPWEMVALLNITQAPVISSGVLFGPTPLNLPIPPDGSLYGGALPLQMVVVNPTTLRFRLSNVASIVMVN